MLPIKNRLIKKGDFEKVFREGRGVSSGPVFLKFRKNGLEEVRLGIVVGIKFSPRAVERNGVKRQMREFFRRELERIRGGFDIVIGPVKRGGVEIQKRQNWDKWLERALEKGKLTIKQ